MMSAGVTPMSQPKPDEKLRHETGTAAMNLLRDALGRWRPGLAYSMSTTCLDVGDGRVAHVTVEIRKDEKWESSEKSLL